MPMDASIEKKNEIRAPPLGLFRVRKEQGDPDFSLYSNVL